MSETTTGDGGRGRPHDPDCLFCKIVDGDVPADLVAEDEHAVAFRDVNPKAPVHVLVVPRAHHRDVGVLAQADPDAMLAVLRLAGDVAEEHAGGQYRLVFNSGRRAGQSVWHVHAHVMGGRDFTWPPG
jgi:histidine triad (HIT) family protein